jgi:acetyltransferase-like isoleucine patch superfamily enzyme
MAKQMKEKQFTSIPYYVPAKNLVNQLSQASEKRKTSWLGFIWIKLRNCLLQRIAYNCPVNSWRIRMHRWRGVTIGKGVMLGMHCILDNAHPEYITIEDYAALAGNNYIITHSNPYLHFKGRLISYQAPVIIRKGAWVAVSSTLLPGTELGKCSIVSAGSTVSGKIPPNVIVCGNPAVVIKEFEPNAEIFSCYK